MGLVFLLIVGLGFSSSTSSWANVALMMTSQESRYLSGQEIYQMTPHIHASENGFFVPVPIDYAHPELGTFDLYAFAPGGFDPSRPTAVYFTGGPGLSAHGESYASSARSIRALGYNAVFFDQRGLGYSRPAHFLTYADGAFYSAHNTSLDADEIRKHLGLKSWVVVGGSYGTGPATRYAHQFADQTQSVVLISTGVGLTRSSAIRAHFALTFMKRADFKQAEQRIRSFRFPSGAVPDHDEAVRTLISILDNYMYLRGTWDVDRMLKYFIENPEAIFRLIALRRRPVAKDSLPTPEDLVLDRDLFVANILSRDERQSYYYEDYVIRSPVTYIQGGGDSRTPAIGAVHHWKSVALGPSQMLLILDAGHWVFRDVIQEGTNSETVPTPYPIPRDVLLAAFRGDFALGINANEKSACQRHLIGERPFQMLQIQKSGRVQRDPSVSN